MNRRSLLKSLLILWVVLISAACGTNLREWVYFKAGVYFGWNARDGGLSWQQTSNTLNNSIRELDFSQITNKHDLVRQSDAEYLALNSVEKAFTNVYGRIHSITWTNGRIKILAGEYSIDKGHE